jgi:hypothetical protein
MITPERAASAIASVIHAKRSLNPAWEALPDEAQQEIVSEWSVLIRTEPEMAAELILRDIARRPALAEAWSQFTSLVSSRGMLGLRNCLTGIVAETYSPPDLHFDFHER